MERRLFLETGLVLPLLSVDGFDLVFGDFLGSLLGGVLYNVSGRVCLFPECSLCLILYWQFCSRSFSWWRCL